MQDRFMDTQTSSPSAISLPDQIGLIVLEDCFHFPGCYLPLYIFEQRYRLMLDHALSSSRMFAVGTTVDGKLLPVTTAGLIRASKKRPDGTSHVMLYGVSRVRFTGWVQEKPFRIATIEPLETLTQNSEDKLHEMKEKALRLLPSASESGEGMRKLHHLLTQVDCPEAVCDILTFHLVRNAETAGKILTEQRLEDRYEVLLDELQMLDSPEREG
jgi:ATP-dependent Lon protease